MTLYQSYMPNSYSYDNAPWDQGHPGYRSPPPYDAGSPISDDDLAEDPYYNSPYSEKPGWSMTARRTNYAGVAPNRPGRTAPHPGGDGGWQQAPGLASGFSRGSRCPQCGKTNPTTDEWGLDDGDGPSSYYYYNVTGSPYGSTPTQPQQGRYSHCPFCGQTRSTTTYPPQYAGTGRALALAPAPATAEDNLYDSGAYYGSSYPGHYSREEWHTGPGLPGATRTQFHNASVAYQGPYSSVGTGPYGHYWQQRHQGPYSSSPSGAPYNFQSPYYSTMGAYSRTNQGRSVGSYPYGVQGMGVSEAARQRMHALYQFSSNIYVERSAGDMGMSSSPYASEYSESDRW